MKASQMVAKVSMVKEERTDALQHSGDLYKCERQDGDFYGDHLCLSQESERKNTGAQQSEKKKQKNEIFKAHQGGKEEEECGSLFGCGLLYPAHTVCLPGTRCSKHMRA